MSPMLEVENLRKTYVTGRTLFGRPRSVMVAVEEVSFMLGRGETLALVGESGAGKSTVGRLVLRLIQPDGGSVRFHREDVLSRDGRALRDYRARARMIFQDPFSSLDPRMVVGQSVAQPLRRHAELDRAGRRAETERLFERVGLGSFYLDRYPYEFSGGQLQRIAVARAIATGPDLVVCDEPVAALDMSIRAQVMNLLHELQDERGMAYLFISHDLSLVRLIADRIAVMYRGGIVELASAADLFANPAHPYTQVLFAAIPQPDLARRHYRLGKTMASRPAAPVGVGCSFSHRCPHAFEPCFAVRPPLIESAGHQVACHLVNGPTSEQPVSAPRAPNKETSCSVNSNPTPR